MLWNLGSKPADTVRLIDLLLEGPDNGVLEPKLNAIMGRSRRQAMTSADVLRNMGNRYLKEKRWPDAARALTYLAAVYDNLAMAKEGAAASFDAGNAYQQGGLPDRAIQLYESGMRFQYNLGDYRKQANILVVLGGLSFDLGRNMEAVGYLHRADDITLEHGLGITRGAVLRMLGRIHAKTQNWAAAADAYAKSEEAYSKVGRTLEAAHSARCLGDVSADLQSWETAIEACSRALSAYVAHDCVEYRATTLKLLGTAYEGAGRLPEALDSYEFSEMLFYALGNDVAGAAALSFKAGVLQRLERWTDASEAASRAINTYLGHGQVIAAGELLQISGRNYFEAGRLLDAKDALNQAVILLSESSPCESQAEACGMLSEAHMFLGEWVESLAHLNQSAEIYDHLQAGHGRVLSLIRRAQLLHAIGQSKQSGPHFERAATMAHELGLVEEELWALAQLGVLELESGRHENAERTIRQAVALAKQHNLGNPWYSSMEILGTILLRANRAEEAIGVFGAALDSAEATGSTRWQGKMTLNIGLARQSTGQWKTAQQTYLNAVYIYRNSESEWDQPFLYNRIASVTYALGDRTSALRFFDKAAKLCHEQGRLHDGAWLDVLQAQAMWPGGDNDEECLQRILPAALFLDSQKFMFHSPSERAAWAGRAGSALSLALELGALTGDAQLVSDLIEHRVNSVTHYTAKRNQNGDIPDAEPATCALGTWGGTRPRPRTASAGWSDQTLRIDAGSISLLAGRFLPGLPPPFVLVPDGGTVRTVLGQWHMGSKYPTTQRPTIPVRIY